jgi:ribosome-binding factor A
VLLNLHVASVVPFPDTSRLLVTVSPLDGRGGPTGRSTAVVLEHLARASGHLRCEIAAAVTRKRTPALVFNLAESSLGVDQ